MYLLFIFLFFALTIIPTNMIDVVYDYYGGDKHSEDIFGKKEIITKTHNEPLWVMKLKGDWLSLKLWRGTESQQDKFDIDVGPFIARYKKRNHNNSTILEHTNEMLKKHGTGLIDINVIRNDIVRTINKFAMFTDLEFNMVQPYDDAPEITFYFRGIYTYLVVAVGFSKLSQWHFFVAPPSPFPAWLYENHTVEGNLYDGIDVPRNITEAFIVSLSKVLEKLFVFPLN